MSEQDSSSSSQTEEDVDEEVERQTEEEENQQQSEASPVTLSSFSSSLRAVIRIKQKYQALKKRRQEMALALGGPGSVVGAPVRTSPKIFTFDGASPTVGLAPPHQRKRRRRRRRVLFPERRRRTPPTQEVSRARNCLYLLLTILFLQVYNAIENLDDHVLRYDLDGLEKMLRREVFGQQGAVEALVTHLRDYLSTYVHNKPLVLSLHGPVGVGKSHLGRLLAGHFRSIVGDHLVLQYYVLHHCPLEADAPSCAGDLLTRVAALMEQAEEEEKIPLLVFDEAEHLHLDLQDALGHLLLTKRSTEHLNAIYLFLSHIGHAHITKHILHNSSSVSMAMTASGRHSNLVKDLTPVLRATLEELHPLLGGAKIVPLGLLDKGHVMECFREEMTREGFYPDQNNIERLAGEIDYYPSVGGRDYSKSGCKQVVSKVNLL
ncbi:torsin-4A-like [Gouania willdenowi]|uniref:Torsin-4A-like n=1 Tax=Gouania willdenowi TaxID=441366 RepID=A0A8C5DP45_GOUWI|nr:torsin-4A-like [Gouania willdenowi]XP_028318894.1 torsin-4A-like [Gouania willdenowi]